MSTCLDCELYKARLRQAQQDAGQAWVLLTHEVKVREQLEAQLDALREALERIAARSRHYEGCEGIARKALLAQGEEAENAQRRAVPVEGDAETLARAEQAVSDYGEVARREYMGEEAETRA